MHEIKLPEDDQPLRLTTIASWMGVSTKTIRREIDRGHLRSVKLRGLRVVLRRDFRAYWEDLKNGSLSHR